VFDIPQAFANPFVERIGMVTQVPHPQRADLRCLASPLRINGERPQASACSPLGADTESVLRGIGFGADEIAALRAGAAV
jgi:crotonobetainyl-CoA:carnitine CoA-transferase CaiB-like acyl-CoA transferase